MLEASPWWLIVIAHSRPILSVLSRFSWAHKPNHCCQLPVPGFALTGWDHQGCGKTTYCAMKYNEIKHTNIGTCLNCMQIWSVQILGFPFWTWLQIRRIPWCWPWRAAQGKRPICQQEMMPFNQEHPKPYHNSWPGQFQKQYPMEAQ